MNDRLRGQIYRLGRLPYFTQFSKYVPLCGLTSLRQDQDAFSGHMRECFESEKKIYIFKAHCTGLYKIGTSKDPMDRLSHLKTSFRKLTLVALYPGGTMLEKFIHNEFRSVREFGEWFNLGEDARIKVGRAIRCFNEVGYSYYKIDGAKLYKKPKKGTTQNERAVSSI